MRVLYADDSPPQGRGFYKVIQLHGLWYVVACGAFYQVDSYQEGIQLVERLRVRLLEASPPSQ